MPQGKRKKRAQGSVFFGRILFGRLPQNIIYRLRKYSYVGRFFLSVLGLFKKKQAALRLWRFGKPQQEVAADVVVFGALFHK